MQGHAIVMRIGDCGVRVIRLVRRPPRFLRCCPAGRCHCRRLLENVHRVGSLHDSADKLLVAVTGAELQPSIFIGKLKSKYTALYGL